MCLLLLCWHKYHKPLNSEELHFAGFDVSLLDPSAGSIKWSNYQKSIVLDSPCHRQAKCTPYVLSLRPGTILFELWGSGHSNQCYKGNGAYTAGFLIIRKPLLLYSYLGGVATEFNRGYSAFGRGGNGAADLRLVPGEWNATASLLSRIMVSGAGGSNFGQCVGFEGQYSINVGDYGEAGGLEGYIGMTANCTNPLVCNHVPWSGNPGTQTSGGSGGYSEYCRTFGHDGNFGIGGAPLDWCPCVPGYTGGPAIIGSSGYYGSGASGSSAAGYWNPTGTAGGSSFISGHPGCNAVQNETTTEGRPIHTNSSIHYSGLYFNSTLMIDGKGLEWTQENGRIVQKKHKMPIPNGGFYEEGHPTDAAIRITHFPFSSPVHKVSLLRRSRFAPFLAWAYGR